MDKFQSLTPGLHICNNEDFFLLGCPILDEAIPLFFSKKIEKFSLLSANLCKIYPHISLFLLRHCFWITKFIYLLRCCPVWKFKHFCLELDNIIHSILEKILNIKFSNRSWAQAKLPVRFGGLGIRSISDISTPAFLASICANSNLINSILPLYFSKFESVYFNEAIEEWNIKSNMALHPSSTSSQRQ
jgi:hypothetical protein